MTYARGATLVATAALLLAGMTACADDGGEPSASPSVSPSSPAPSTSTTTPPSESESASESASALVRTYFATIDLVRQDSKQPARKLDAVASSSELVAQKNLLKSQRQGGLHQVGDTTIVELTVESVSLDEPVTAIVDVCWDVSGVDILDASGDSVVTPERKNVGWTRFTVTNQQWDAAPTDGWRVSGGRDLEKEPCAGS